MASYLHILLVAVCVISACNCDFFGDANIQTVSPSDLLAIQDTSSLFLLVNEEFTSSSFISSVEFYATAAGTFGLGFMTWPSCGKANQPSCASYIKDTLMSAQAFIAGAELARLTIPVSQAGYVNYKLPEKVLVPTGFVPFIVQGTAGVNFVVSQLPDFKRFWRPPTYALAYEPLFTAAGSPIKALIKINVDIATLSTDTISYGIPVPTQADANTVLTVPQGFGYFLINAPVTYDSFITSFEIYAAKAGTLAITSSTFRGCQIGDASSCVDLMVNYRNTNKNWLALARLGSAPSVTLNIQPGYNKIDLATPLFVQRKAVLQISQSTGQVALENVDVPVSDLIFSGDSNGQYKRVGTNPNQAFLLRANAQYFALPSA